MANTTKLSRERYDELFCDTVNFGTSLGNGDYQKGDAFVQAYSKNGNTIYGSLWIKGVRAEYEKQEATEPPGV